MGQDLITKLPTDMMIEILSRLSLRSAIRCQCVYKSWLSLLATPDYANSRLSHFPKAEWGLAVFERKNLESMKSYKIVEFVDQLDPNFDERRWNVVFSFDHPFFIPVHSSVNGLLFLCNRSLPLWMVICNPITRDYIKLPEPQVSSTRHQLSFDTYGFGVSRKTRKYKVVRILFGVMLKTGEMKKLAESECHVYTVGTGSWRRIGSCAPLLNFADQSSVGAFLNGNLHWLTRDLEGFLAEVSCFDLETEHFSTFSPLPPYSVHRSPLECRSLYVAGYCLRLCDIWQNLDTSESMIVLWLMKESRGQKSWTKKFVIRLPYTIFPKTFRVVKDFQDGDMLIECSHLFYYSNKTQTLREFDAPGLSCFKIGRSAVIYDPSFVSLKSTFEKENVFSFRSHTRSGDDEKENVFSSRMDDQEHLRKPI